MDTLVDTREVSRTQDLDNVMKRIEANCGSEGEGISFFKDPTTTPMTDQEARVQRAGNIVFDGLMYTLNEIGFVAVDQAKRGGVADSYETVARTIEPMSQICRALADDRLPLQKNTALEQDHQQVGDTVHAYRTGRLVLDGREYHNVRVFIRPRKYARPLNARKAPNRPELTLTEKADPRMSITMLPKDSPMGEVTIRIDEEGLAQDETTRDYMITYDIEVGRGEWNLMDRLDFTGVEGAQAAQTGQREGHHFSSSWTAKELKTTFADLLEGFNKKFETVAKK